MFFFSPYFDCIAFIVILCSTSLTGAESLVRQGLTKQSQRLRGSTTASSPALLTVAWLFVEHKFIKTSPNYYGREGGKARQRGDFIKFDQIRAIWFVPKPFRNKCWKKNQMRAMEKVLKMNVDEAQMCRWSSFRRRPPVSDSLLISLKARFSLCSHLKFPKNGLLMLSLNSTSLGLTWFPWKQGSLCNHR